MLSFQDLLPSLEKETSPTAAPEEDCRWLPPASPFPSLNTPMVCPVEEEDCEMVWEPPTPMPARPLSPDPSNIYTLDNVWISPKELKIKEEESFAVPSKLFPAPEHSPIRPISPLFLDVRTEEVSLKAPQQQQKQLSTTEELDARESTERGAKEERCTEAKSRRLSKEPCVEKPEDDETSIPELVEKSRSEKKKNSADAAPAKKRKPASVPKPAEKSRSEKKKNSTEAPVAAATAPAKRKKNLTPDTESRPPVKETDMKEERSKKPKPDAETESRSSSSNAEKKNKQERKEKKRKQTLSDGKTNLRSTAEKKTDKKERKEKIKPEIDSRLAEEAENKKQNRDDKKTPKSGNETENNNEKKIKKNEKEKQMSQTKIVKSQPSVVSEGLEKLKGDDEKKKQREEDAIESEKEKRNDGCKKRPAVKEASETIEKNNKKMKKTLLSVVAETETPKQSKTSEVNLFKKPAPPPKRPVPRTAATTFIKPPPSTLLPWKTFFKDYKIPKLSKTTAPAQQERRKETTVPAAAIAGRATTERSQKTISIFSFGEKTLGPSSSPAQQQQRETATHRMLKKNVPPAAISTKNRTKNSRKAASRDETPEKNLKKATPTTPRDETPEKNSRKATAPRDRTSEKKSKKAASTAPRDKTPEKNLLEEIAKTWHKDDVLILHPEPEEYREFLKTEKLLQRSIDLLGERRRQRCSAAVDYQTDSFSRRRRANFLNVPKLEECM